ncbi:Ring-h2 finger protein atl73 [Thalictrum thalictroides]|uniref:Ring-h2 finger protein atl73 n=1 Tax=Thalictrum thalictroides TaxID=46969 RepID=A0A7J6UVK1_THATH|nr:Ring-h2 finger protein atl73 [Thalictrum thalictroides]
MKLAGVEPSADAAAAECAICLSEFVQGEGIRILPKCKHGFHVKCIEAWLSAHVSCPTCRTTCIPPSPPRNYDVESQSPCVPVAVAVPPLSAASEPLQRPMSE